jgi:hypothetical protein
LYRRPVHRSCLTVAIVVVVAAASASAPPPARAAPAVPKVCGAYVSLPTGAPGTSAVVHAVGKVKSITPRRGPARFEIVVADAKGDQTFTLSVTPPSLPFKVGDQLDVSLRRGGGWHRPARS